MTPKVSICITTYNHEKWIVQAIESVLCQKTDFPFEIILGEDDSDDNTREIVVDYASRYPKLIKAFLNDRKNVVYIDGFATGRWNFINNIKNARGEYIAMLEGDDYWCDPNKLQKQVAILDTHPEHAICFHDAWIKESDGELVSDYITTKVAPVTTLHDLANGNYIHTPTCMFRRKNMTEIPSWLWKTRIGDYPIHMINAKCGSIYKIDDRMAVYRNSGQGTHSSLSIKDKQEAWLQTLDIIISELEVDQDIKDRLINNLVATTTALVSHHLESMQYEHMRSILIPAVNHDPLFIAEAVKALPRDNKLHNTISRLCNHPITGPVIALVRLLKRDPSFGKY